MPKLFQYGRSVSNQGAGIITRPTSGLNEYLPSNAINDNLMSDLIDVYPYRDECILFNVDPSITELGASVTAAKGSIRACIHSDESSAAEDVFYLMTAFPVGWKLIKHKYTFSTGVTSLTEFTVVSDSIPADNNLVDSSSCVFKTEADTFYVFSNTYEKRIHFIKHTPTSNTYAYVDLPAYPKKMVSHASRIFFIDTENKLWWCRGGDLYSWYSMEYDADAVVTTRNCANAAFIIAAQPSTTRPITITVTKTDTLDTLGIMTLVGTNGLGEAQTEVLTLIEGRVQSSKSYATLTTVTQSGWTQGGATPDTIVVGVAPVSLGFVTDDAGYWTLEQEPALHDLCAISGSMYIFSNHDIYVFQGYSPDSFSLTKIIADIGIERMVTPNGYHKLTTGHNDAYFIYDGLVYEFNGNNKPTIISRPSTVNGQSSNGIFGGINVGGESWVLSSMSDSLCIYDYTGVSAYYYLYIFETKTWWKMSSVLKDDIDSANSIYVLRVPSFDRGKWFSFVSVFSGTIGYALLVQHGCMQNSVMSFVVSKAYNTNPSETGSLTEVVLLLRADLGSSADIKIQYSLSVSSDDFINIKTFERFVFNGDLEVLSIPVPVSNIANAHHYRLKISIGNFSGTTGVYLYNVERRFRVKGRSR